MTQIPPNPVIVKVGCDATRFTGAVCEFGDLLASAPERVFDNLLGLRDVMEQFFCIKHDDRAGPGEVVVRLEPTDFLLRLLAAMRAGDWDRAEQISKARA